MPGTVRLHRVLTAPPERVYKAFIDPEAVVKWLPPHGFTAKVHSQDPRVDGRFKMSFTNFSTGTPQHFGGEYLEMNPGVSLKYTDSFDDPNLPGQLKVSVSFKAVSCGTELGIVQEGIPDAIPVELCHLGWQQSLNQLAVLVEPEIKEGVMNAKAERSAKQPKEPGPTAGDASALIDQRILELGGWRGATLARMRGLVQEAVPGVEEQWKWRGVPVWEKNGMLCTGEAYKDVVKLTFAKGAALPDPGRLFNAGLEGGTRRAIDIREGETVDAAAFKALVKAAAALNGAKAKA